MRTLANPVAGYVGAVLGVIAVASVAVFNLQGTAAKTQRHWDAEIDLIIARQQAKKQDMDTAVVSAHAEIPDEESDAGPQFAVFATGSIQEDEDEPAFTNEGAAAQKVQNQIGKSHGWRGDERRKRHISSALATVPKFAAAAAAATTTLLRLR